MKNAEHWLAELLACLHGDGGQYLDEHGMEKATRDAIAKHYEQVKVLDRTTWENDLYRSTIERISRQWAQPARDIALATLAEANESKP